MKREVVPVGIRGILPMVNHGWAIFVGNKEKAFVISVEQGMGMAIERYLRHAENERPLTHDLMLQIFKGLGVTIERVVITELKDSTYYARLILRQENELGTKLVELDARPSDCLALASAKQVPVYVAKSLFDKVEDMSEHLDRIKEGSQGEE